MDDIIFMNILSVFIVKTNGTDKVFLHTDLPNPVYNFKGNLTLTFDVAHGNGESYVKEHFPELPLRLEDDRK